MSDTATVTLFGTVRSSVLAQGPDLYLLFETEVQPGQIVHYRILSEGDTLEGFSPGDRQSFAGKLLRLNSLNQIVVRV